MSTGTDLVTIIGNVSRSMFPVQYLLSAFAYVLGTAFFMIGIAKLKKIGESRGRSQEKLFVPIAYFLGGSALLFIPTTVSGFANTAFGTGNILQYTSYNPFDVYSSMATVIKTAGIIWFIRGCVLLVGSSKPGEQHGPKGLAFLCAGVLAMNFQNTTAMASAIMGQLSNLTKGS
ncbi:hypothetical protein BN59_01026 [Legionella massiliensis]|uniref:Uncharacterized protein n=1 Tax=Legionella massiliensis TaxID=1034943 RepID=A0A078KUN0_9GAMM|nr:hypothetical protein [Legionella massiliensis]CDZ76751.1 hypothetical protein BN59_01026 [Legionella massiliensis]CEE12489.1 hypothetical protein BN1094_01026 [Legionella massiliensis]